MKAHIIENSVVVNTIVVDSLDFIAGLVETSKNGGIGWSYINGRFVDNRPQPDIIALTAPTKEQLLAELRELTTKINALG